MTTLTVGREAGFSGIVHSTGSEGRDLREAGAYEDRPAGTATRRRTTALARPTGRTRVSSAERSRQASLKRARIAPRYTAAQIAPTTTRCTLAGASELRSA